MTRFPESKALCAAHATSFFLASQLLPPPQRDAAYAIYGFCRHADNLVDNANESGKRESDILHLRNQLSDAWNGQKTIPLVDAFVETCHEYGISQKWGFDLLHGLSADLEKKTYATFDELYYYCYHVASIPGILIAHIGGAPPHAYAYAEALGIGMQLTNIIRDAREDAQMGRIYFPHDELREFEVNESQLLAGEINEPLRAFLAFQVARARKYYDEAQKGMNYLPVPARTALELCAVFYRAILDEVEKRDYDIFTQRVTVSPDEKERLLNNALHGTPLPPHLA